MDPKDAELGRKLVARLGRPVRLVLVAVLAMLMLIPLKMVESVVRERYATYRTVVADIAGAWSCDQLVAGPFLVVPFTERVEVRDEFVTPQGEKKVVQRWESRDRRAVLLPDTLGYRGRLEPELRRRGIYRVRVYTADLTVEGAFRDPEAAVRSLVDDDRLERIDWSRAVVGFGVTDPRGIVEASRFEVDGRPIQPRPGTTLGVVAPSGFHLAVGELAADGLELRLPLLLRGSDSLRFLPLGEVTHGSFESDWPHPSFIGDVLPATRTVGDAGFSAEWTVPLLNRSYPQAWVAGAGVDIGEIEAGVRLFEPVALYDLVTRAVKYGLLFVVLTFLTLGLIELVSGARPSLVQYLLIGISLAMFFLILVALAEHVGFAAAYLAASAIVVVINTLYCAAILPRRWTSVLVGGVLAAIYGILYTILRAEDFALLGGTALLTAALAVTMYFTRRIHRAGGEDPTPL